MKRFLRDTAGTTTVELSVVFILLLLATFGIAEFSLGFYEWNSAEKATERGARIAVTSTPVAAGLETKDCGTDSTPLGTPCADTSDNFGTITCRGATKNCDGDDDYGFNEAAFLRIYNAMRAVHPRIEPEHVVVSYSDIRLGFKGRGGPVPLVTVQLRDVPFNWIVIGALAGLDDITLPTFTASLTAEDLRSTFP